MYFNYHNILRKALMRKPLIGELCSQLIKEALIPNDGSMIARFGSVEIKAIIYPLFPSFLRHIIRERVFSSMETNAGFFPVNEQSVQKFSKLMISDMKLLDVLGSWRIEESLLKHNYHKAKIIELSKLEPYFQVNPWTEVLGGKKVLVIHPFNKTIEDQYFTNRTNLFKDKRVLPEFKSLETIKAVQTIAGNKSEFANWFEALESMKREIETKDFDIAIIGCGAYGFPLAAHVKRIGKKAVHLGGATQILFGIKGKRWLENEKFNTIINDYFVFPMNEDKPENAEKVEDGCYW